MLEKVQKQKTAISIYLTDSSNICNLTAVEQNLAGQLL